MFQIGWKSFKANNKNFLTFFISVIASIATLFVFVYVKEYVRNISYAGIYEDQANNYLEININMLIPSIIVASTIIIVYSLRFYIKTRVKDYGMLSILGIRKKDMRRILICEYTLACTFSCLIGIVSGRVIVEIIRTVSNRVYGIDMRLAVSMAGVYKGTVFLCIMLILLSIFGISILLSEKNLSDLVHTDIQKDKMWESPKSLWCLLGGILIILCGSFLAVFYNGNIGEILQIYLLLVGSGLFMALVFGTGYLNTIQKRKREYDRILLKWERFYHKINKNNCMILIQTMIGFVVIILAFHVNCAVIGRQERQTKYPADFLCTYDSNSDFLMRFKEKYGEDCKEFQFVRIASGKTAPLLGISVEQYNKMFKKNEILNENEAIAIFHENAVVGTLIENQKNKESADIFFGKSSEIDWLAKEDARYVMKKEEIGDIFGFALDVDGVVILSNQDFQKARVKDGAYESIALLNVKNKERDSATQFLKEQNLTGMLSKEIEKEKEVKDQLLEILILSVLGGLAWFFSLFIMWLKIFSEMDNLKKKYDFLYVLGMKPEEQREVLKYESVIPIKIQIVVTVVLALLFGATQIFRLTGKESVIGWTGFIFALMMYLIVEFLFLKFIQRWVQKEILQDTI